MLYWKLHVPLRNLAHIYIVLYIFSMKLRGSPFSRLLKASSSPPSQCFPAGGMKPKRIRKPLKVACKPALPNGCPLPFPLLSFMFWKPRSDPVSGIFLDIL